MLNPSTIPLENCFLARCWWPYGYAEYVEAISDENHPDHEDMIEWGYEDFDPAVFNLEIANRILKAIKL